MDRETEEKEHNTKKGRNRLHFLPGSWPVAFRKGDYVYGNKVKAKDSRSFREKLSGRTDRL